MQYVFEVNAMSCKHCVAAITQAVQYLDPQARVRVDLEEKKVHIESAQPRQVLADAMAAEGYAVVG